MSQDHTGSGVISVSRMWIRNMDKKTEWINMDKKTEWINLGTQTDSKMGIRKPERK